mmetsp:Transcript_10246/g.26040  ORF Transcript_10246/g.26040 Transcript_10246/m.26040 type:complete len:338 (-) Transcript_10246:399-1412(-)
MNSNGDDVHPRAAHSRARSFFRTFRTIDSSLQGHRKHSIRVTSSARTAGVLQKHNASLEVCTGNTASVAMKLDATMSTCQSLHDSLSQLERLQHSQHVAITSAHSRVGSLESMIEQIQSKTNHLGLIETKIQSYKNLMDEVVTACDVTQQALSDRVSVVEKNERLLCSRLESMSAAVSVIERRLDALPNDVRISSDNVSCSKCIPGKHQTLSMELSDLKHCCHVNDVAVKRTNQLLDAFERVLRSKAPAGVEVTLKRLASHVQCISNQLRAHPQAEMSIMRSLQMNHTDTLNATLAELKEKISRDELDAAIEERYGEIMSYLRSSIHAATINEVNLE